MPLTEDIMRRVLPGGTPDADLTNRAETARFEELLTREGPDSLLARVLKWQSLILWTLERYREEILQSLRTGPWDSGRHALGVGFAQVPPDLLAHPLIGRASAMTDWVFGAVLKDFSFSPEGVSEQAAVDLGQFHPALANVPAFRAAVIEEPHSASHLTIASGACWALRGNATVHDVLTAAHCFSWRGTGQPVAFLNGHQGHVAVMTPYPVDAALVTPVYPPTGEMTEILREAAPVSGEPFDFDGRFSGMVQGRVTTCYVLPGVSDPARVQSVDLDTPGQPGDSGALVRSPRTGRALGIYSGVQRSQTTPGIFYIHSQAIEQACALLDITLWEDT